MHSNSHADGPRCMQKMPVDRRAASITQHIVIFPPASQYVYIYIYICIYIYIYIYVYKAVCQPISSTSFIFVNTYTEHSFLIHLVSNLSSKSFFFISGSFHTFLFDESEPRTHLNPRETTPRPFPHALEERGGWNRAHVQTVTYGSVMEVPKQHVFGSRTCFLR